MGSNFQKYAPAISSAFTLVIYFITMSRGVMPIDAGELAASQYTLGISHPSGYPLFNIIGFLWSKLPIGTVIFRLNLLCAIWVALANFFLVKTAFLILQKVFVTQPISVKKDGKQAAKLIAVAQPSAFLLLLAAISGILIIAFCRLWWIQSAGVEVYSLHVALLSIFFFVFLQTYYKEKPTSKDWILSGVFLGLCFTNHLTSVLVLPGVIFLYFMKMKFTIHSIKSGLIMAGAFALVFGGFYYFMMTRAGSDPMVNYGNPNNMEYLKRHITGWQFQSFMTGSKKPNEIYESFIKNFALESAVVGLLLFIIGGWVSMIKNWKMNIFWSLHFLSTLIYASRYDIHDIENYFLLCYMCIGIFMTFGIYWVLSKIKSLEKKPKPALAVFFVLLLPLALNYPKANQSNRHYIDQFSIGALNSVEPNAIIFTREWDVFVSPIYYYHLVEKMRPDVLIIDKELLRRSWYHNQIKAWDKNFASKVEKQANEFAEAVIPFERKLKFDPVLIQKKFEAYILAILSEYKNRPVYISSLVMSADIMNDIDVQLPKGAIPIADAYFYKLVDSATTKYSPLAHPLEYSISYADDKTTDRFQMQIFNSSMNMLSKRVEYEILFGKKAEAKKIIEIMQEADPRVEMPKGL